MIIKEKFVIDCPSSIDQFDIFECNISMNIPLRYDSFYVNVTLNDSSFQSIQLELKSLDYKFKSFIVRPGILQLTFTDTMYGSEVSKILHVAEKKSKFFFIKFHFIT